MQNEVTAKLPRVRANLVRQSLHTNFGTVFIVLVKHEVAAKGSKSGKHEPETVYRQRQFFVSSGMAAANDVFPFLARGMSQALQCRGATIDVVPRTTQRLSSQ